MSSYTLSVRADSDIEEIARSSAAEWGRERAEAYILALHNTCLTLAAFPELGRDSGHIREGYRRIGSGSHIIFYRVESDEVLVVRVLHQSMDIVRHL